jgi:hypothetical protein
MVVKQLIEGGDHVKGTHTNPEVRKPSKKQDLAVRKKQDLAVRKKTDHYWTDVGSRRQSDAELQQDFQLRFKTLGGEGIVSPQKAILHCRTKTRFFSKDTKVGLRGVSMQKRKRWTLLACHRTR